MSDLRYLSDASMAQLTPPPSTALEPRRDTTSDTNEVIDTTTIETS